MLYPDDENELLKTAYDFILKSNHPIFLTGKAGTGKTSFLKFIKEHCGKNVAVVAPTGVAAINAGGNTIHSFFQLPFTPYIPVNKNHFGAAAAHTDRHSLIGKLKISSERKEVMQQLELLIIDEISMVRCDILDAIDLVLRHVRNNYNKPFGGLQVLYIGDMYQLPPVIKEEEWRLLNTCYAYPFFFNSLVVNEQPPVYIELKKVYRQKDQVFIQLLNKVRNNEMEDQDYILLHSRFMPEFKPEKSEGFITLTTHNHKADAINMESLAEMPSEATCFRAAIDGEFNEKAFPADEYLNVKPGAQVMFIKNDVEKIRRYYNGKIGIIQKIDENSIWVTCAGQEEEQLIEVKKETWRNIRYLLNEKNRQVEERELGTFSQFPLRLAWAITIHKSQGLTFEKAIIDAGAAFSPGQVYVALSRCTSLEGIVLYSKISAKTLLSDERIVHYTVEQKAKHRLEDILRIAVKRYQETLLKDLFDFSAVITLIDSCLDWVKENSVFGSEVQAWLKNIKDQLSVYRQHGQKFCIELDELFKEDCLPEENISLQTRLTSAAEWFIKALNHTKDDLLLSPAVTDNKQHAFTFNKFLENINSRLHYLLLLLQGCRADFSIEKYMEKRRSFVSPVFSVNAFSGKSVYISKSINHPELYRLLREKRDALSIEKKLPSYRICSAVSLEEMTNYLPQNPQELCLISGFGKINTKRYGDYFLQIITEYCINNDVDGNITALPTVKKEVKKGKPEKIDSKISSLMLFKKGKNITEIAMERKLAISTVEGHFMHLISSGDIQVSEILESDKINAVKKIIKKDTGAGIKEIKEQLPDISYTEIRWVLAAEKTSAL